MRTAAQIEASKRNGAKSKGPVTSEGRVRSSQNAIRHGLTSHKIVVIDGESKEEWEMFQREFFLKFQPRDFVEESIVMELAVCQWRLERIWRMQVAVLDQGIADELPVIEEQYEQFDMPLVQACAHTSRKLDLQSLDQLETRISRRFHRALRNYNEIRAQFPPQPEPPKLETGSEPQLAVQPDPQPLSQPEIAKWEKEPESKIHPIDLPRISVCPLSEPPAEDLEARRSPEICPV
jgi:hypothetical protein